MSLRRAISWSLFWVGAAFAFAWLLTVIRDAETAQLFLAGYVLEKSLSVDNLMVFAAIFSYFRISSTQQPRILNLGIIGAVVLRAIFVALGSGALLLIGPSAGLVFGLIVLWSAVKMLGMGSGDDDEETDYNTLWFVRLARKLHTAPAFLCLVAIEISDIIFAFDSVPAVIAVVQEPLIVYASVMFAVLGLRSLYFVLDALMGYLVHLEKAVIGILFFVGAKLTLHSASELTGANVDYLNVSPMMNLAIVLGALSLGVIASIMLPNAEAQP